MRRINDILEWICRMMIIVMVLVMTLVIFLQVVLRYIFSAPLPWPEELGTFLLVWASCFGAAYATRYGMNIALLFIHQRFRGVRRHVVNGFIFFVLLALCVVCIVEGTIVSLAQWDQVTASLRMPVTINYLAIPISFAFVMMFSIEVFIEDLKKN